MSPGSRRVMTQGAALAVATLALPRAAPSSDHAHQGFLQLPSRPRRRHWGDHLRDEASRSASCRRGSLWPLHHFYRHELVVVAVRDPAQLVLLSARTGRVLRRVSIAGAARFQLATPTGPVLVPQPASRYPESVAALPQRCSLARPDGRRVGRCLHRPGQYDPQRQAHGLETHRRHTTSPTLS